MAKNFRIGGIVKDVGWNNIHESWYNRGRDDYVVCGEYVKIVQEKEYNVLKIYVLNTKYCHKHVIPSKGACILYCDYSS